MATARLPKISPTNTKQEMLDAYNKLVELFDTKKDTEIKATEKIEEKEAKKAIEKTDELTPELINKKIAELKFEFGSTLTKLSEMIEEEFSKYQNVQRAVVEKEKELSEIYEIGKNANSLYALLEAQKIKKDEFLEEMDELQDKLENDIKEKRIVWEKERIQKEAENKEREKQELAKRDREKEEYYYNFQREQKIARDKFESEKSALEKSLSDWKENNEKDLKKREEAIAESEAELQELRIKTAEFPKELARSIDKAVKEATERILLEAKHKEELLKSSFDGETKSLHIRIESLEKTIKEQSDIIAKYSSQLEKSYNQIQDIATQAVQGSSNKQPVYTPNIQPVRE